MSQYSFYAHGGSRNHGCEALARTTARMLGGEATLYSKAPEQDRTYGVTEQMTVTKCGENVRRFSPRHIAGKLSASAAMYIARSYEYRDFLREAKGICFSIGGDNYCYGKAYRSLIGVDRALIKSGRKTVLWGCSIEPDSLSDSELVEDLRSFSLITARESLTYDALCSAGLTNVRLYPDPAFTLPVDRQPLPKGFAEGNTIGLNLSPLIMSCETKDGAAFKNFESLITHIIETTDMQIALIPHVVWDGNDDRVPLRALAERFADSGRVVLVDDANAETLKGVISRCRFFIGARTHATIAAYSTCVPTLVVGYSVKAEGMAKDLYGTYENYVMPVQSLESGDELNGAFDWLCAQEDAIRSHLQAIMPDYIRRAYAAADEVKKIHG